jgi:hypothetical protein
MTDALQMLHVMVGAQLAQEPLPTPDRIRELIGMVAAVPLFSTVTTAELEQLAHDFEASHGITMSIGAVLTEEGYEPWLADARTSITPYYWDRYKKLMSEKGFSGQVLATLDNVTDTILNALENPKKPGPWDRRGMVVGHVQSGKTANYTGLLCKAADAGYKLIVVIAGIHNNLRNQTQQRIDEGFVGRDSASMMSNKEGVFIGVGRYGTSRRPVTFTNSIKDFNKAMATGMGVPLQNLNEPAVFVIKKNSSTLKNLLEWLQEHSAQVGTSKVDAPMLLIDDEADNASINTAKRDEISRINGQIRELLNLFDRSCYVGYTATPFANIFIDPKSNDAMRGQDLFPRHFIVSLDPPSNYFGANKVFLDEPEKILRTIDDNEDVLPLVHGRDIQITALPPSLLTAIRVFVLGRAIRLVRGQNKAHCSMLVNASRFTDTQRQLRNEIHQALEGIRASIRVNGALPAEKALKDPQLKALYDAWSEEFEKTSGVTWEDVQSRLNDSIAPISVVEVNSRSSGTLNYGDHKTGLNVIAVGGYALSRGLTLEGLMVSYFLRNSIMYDTLMQMGRWFGYRPGYEDLCRVWMPEAAEGWYAHVTESIDELREELRKMEAANATPEQFGLKVRSHPDTLIVTARNKMGSGERMVVSIGLAKRFVETSILKRDTDNLEPAQHLAEGIREQGLSLSDENLITGGYLVSNAPVSLVDRFLSEFRNHPASMLTDSGPIRRYIDERKDDELSKWDILFTSLKQTDSKTLINTSLGVKIACQRRTKGIKSTDLVLYVSDKQRVSSRGIERTGLTDAEKQEAERKFRADPANKDKPENTKFNYPDRVYRAERKRPLLIVHLLAIGGDDEDLSKTSPVVAWSISFPPTELEEKLVEYVVNDTWLKENNRDDVDEEELDGTED